MKDIDDSETLEIQEIMVAAPHGLSGTIARHIARAACELDASTLLITHSGARADSKDILAMLMLGVGRNTQVTLVSYGPHAARATDAIGALLAGVEA